jgi:hypothetical protein
MIHEVFDGRDPLDPDEDVDESAGGVLEALRNQGFGE